MPPLPVAQVELEAIMGIGIGFCMFVVVPLVFMLLHHQRRMAELFRDRAIQSNDTADRRIEALERRIEELGYRVNDAILASEDRRSLDRETPPPVEEIHRRLNS